MPEGDVVDVALLQAGAPDQLGEGEGRQVGCAEGGERAPEAAHGGTDRLADHDVAHVDDGSARPSVHVHVAATAGRPGGGHPEQREDRDDDTHARRRR